MIEITPLEESLLDAMEFTNGLACLWHVQELMKLDSEAKIGIKDRSLPDDVRSQAIKDLRSVNDQLSVVAAARAVVGITA